MSSPQLSLLVLRTVEPEALLPFYEALGLQFQSEQHGSGPIHFSCEMGAVVLEIYPLKKGQNEANSSPMLGFRVASIAKTLEKLSAIGVKSAGEIKTSEWGRWCNVLDLDGRTVQLSE